MPALASMVGLPYAGVRYLAALAHRQDVTIHVHDAGNHLFFPGAGPSAPAEYVAPQHVDPAVITDIATWLTSR